MFQLDSDIYNKAAQSRLSERLGNQNIAASQQEMGLNDEKLKQAKVERAVQYLGMATPENWQSIRQQAIGEGLGDEQTIPQQYDENWISQTRNAFSSAKANTPASIQEYSFYNTLGKDDQEKYLNVKRAQQVINLGGSQVVRSPTGGVSETYEVTPKPGEMPKFKQNQAFAERTGANMADLEQKPAIEGATKAAQLNATQSNDIDNSLADIRGFRNSNARFKDALSKTGMTGPVAGRYGDAVSNPGRVDLVSAQNELTLKAKSLLGMPSSNFSDADRDFITEIAGGRYGSGEGLQKVSDRLDIMAQQQEQSLLERKKMLNDRGPNLNTPIPPANGNTPSGQIHEGWPDAAQHAGRVITNEVTGDKFRSDGKTWVPQ